MNFRIFTPAVAAILLFLQILVVPVAIQAQTDELDTLFEQLANPVDGNWKDVETQIWQVWSSSGSDAMDLLLERGRQAMQVGELEKAVEHLTALTDLAPDFAEGWNARATVFFMLDEFALSMRDIEVVLSLNPRHFGALSGMGMILETVDRPKDALKAYQAAEAVHPHRPDIQQAVERLKKKTAGTTL